MLRSTLLLILPRCRRRHRPITYRTAHVSSSESSICSASLKAAIDAQLREHECSTVVAQDAIYSVDVNQINANQPIEDYHSAGKCITSNAWLFGVFDGHAGASCSRYVSGALFDYICASVLAKHLIATDDGIAIPAVDQRLQWLFSSAETAGLPSTFREAHLAAVRTFHRHFIDDAKAGTVRKALQAAFTSLDADLSANAMPNRGGHVNRLYAGIAMSGSCATVAHIRGPHLHIANLGDSAAILGVCGGSHGGWTARQLSREHCSENPDEVKRIRAAHPAHEANMVLRGGRLLGQLYPLRAFGDVRYKWSADLLRVVMQPIYGAESVPPGLETPPYLTAQPEVYYHRLTPNDRFLVLATDGLWEWLEPETVVRLVSDHMLGVQTLTPYQPNDEANLMQVITGLRGRKAGETKRPIDENSATHVIRHAIGATSGTQDEQYNRLAVSLQLPAGVARNHRDDITVTVIYFNQDYLHRVHTDEHI